MRTVNLTKDALQKPRKALKKPKNNPPIQPTPSLGRTNAPEPTKGLSPFEQAQNAALKNLYFVLDPKLSVSVLDERPIALPASVLKPALENITKVLPETAFRGTVDTRQTAPDKDLRETAAGTFAPRMKAMPKRNRPKTSLRAAARATTFREKSKTDRSKNRNYPGYRAPGKIGTKLVGADVPSATHAAFQQAALAEKKTMKELLTDFINAKAKNFLAPEVQKECAKQKPARVREKQNAAHKWLGLA